MHLAFGVARADRAPAHRVGDVLRAGGLQELGGRRKTGAEHVKQCLAREQQALLDVVAAVDVRVVDQALPPHRRARFFEVDAHHDEQFVLEFAAHPFEPARVVERGGRVVDRAWPDEYLFILKYPFGYKCFNRFLKAYDDGQLYVKSIHKSASDNVQHIIGLQFLESKL